MPTLTRYLYEKDNCLNCFIWAILDKRKEEALFWAFELYFSGFMSDITSLIDCLITTLYSETHPDFVAYYAKHKDIQDPVELGTIIKTMLKCRVSFTHVLRGSVSTDITPQNTVYDCMTQDELNQYLTCTPKYDGYRSWKVLRVCCEFPANPKYICDSDHIPLLGCSDVLNAFDNKMHLDLFDKNRWLYYTGNTPIWKKGIDEFRGTLDHEQRIVQFPSETMEEEFYNLYGYEPDEQPKDVQEAIWPTHYTEPITWANFVELYGKTNVYKEVKIKKTKSKTK
jgi:hypothetical protein